MKSIDIGVRLNVMFCVVREAKSRVKANMNF